MKIKFTNYNEFLNAKYILVYSGQNSEVIKFDGLELEITDKMKKLLDKNKIKYEKLKEVKSKAKIKSNKIK